MSNIKEQVPAFPLDAYSMERGFDYGYGEKHGMSLRDYFAAKAMQALLPDIHNEKWAEIAARESYKMADAMLKAREEAEA